MRFEYRCKLQKSKYRICSCAERTRVFKRRNLKKIQWSTWPFFSEIAIWKSSKNNEKKSKGAPFYDKPIAQKSSLKLPVTSQGQIICRALWRHRQLQTRFPGDRLIVEGCSFGLFFIIFWALSNGYLRKKWSSTPYEMFRVQDALRFWGLKRVKKSASYTWVNTVHVKNLGPREKLRYTWETKTHVRNRGTRHYTNDRRWRLKVEVQYLPSGWMLAGK